jgi:hypothetical protein
VQKEKGAHELIIGDRELYCGDVVLIDSQMPHLLTLAGSTIYLAVPDGSIVLRHAAFRRAGIE